MKLIDKDALVAEIERMLHETVNNTDGSPYYGGRAGAFTAILSFINTLEVKDVDLDNHTIMEEIRKCGCNPSEFDVARHFFELGLKTNQEK